MTQKLLILINIFNLKLSFAKKIIKLSLKRYIYK